MSISLCVSRVLFFLVKKAVPYWGRLLHLFIHFRPYVGGVRVQGHAPGGERGSAPPFPPFPPFPRAPHSPLALLMPRNGMRDGKRRIVADGLIKLGGDDANRSKAVRQAFTAQGIVQVRLKQILAAHVE